ncbi:MAG: DUF5673 domain-containing protein [Clostridium sp.]|nr:DUF5673 domain-containing protein [Clostridium sp.]
MDVWINVLGFVFFLGFATAAYVCILAIKRQEGIVIKSRLHHRVNKSEVIYANVGLVIFAVLMYFHYFVFAPAVLAFVFFIVLSTRIQSGITEEGALVGTIFIEWEFMKSYKLVDDPSDSNIIILKIRANRRQYVMVCERRDRFEIAKIFDGHEVEITHTIANSTTDEEAVKEDTVADGEAVAAKEAHATAGNGVPGEEAVAAAKKTTSIRPMIDEEV